VSTAELARARSLLEASSRILVFTGAGLSTESGIPDFRGPDGLWSKVDPDDFTIDRYVDVRDIRVRSWQMHARGELWGARSNAGPNPGHRAVAALWDSGRMIGCITQNVDGLHRKSGLPDAALAEVHGDVRSVVCLGCHGRWETETVLRRVDSGDPDPHCLACGGLLKTNTVLFGEMLPDRELTKASWFAAEADAVVAVGTTLSVYPAAEFALMAAVRAGRFVIVNLGPTEADDLADVVLAGSAGETLPLLFAS